MLRRIGILLRARAALARRAGWPIPALLFQALLGTVLALLVRDLLPPFPRAFFALAVNALVLALPLLSELALLLRRDEGVGWIGALPVRAGELALARTLHLLGLLLALSLAGLLPFGLLGPEPLHRAWILCVLGLLQALALAGVLIALHQLFLERFPGLLVLLQTALVVVAVAGLLLALGHLPELARMEPPGTGPSWVRWVPVSWFAAPPYGGGLRAWLPPLAAGSLGLLGLFLVRGSGRPSRRVARGPLETALVPLRALATRTWVRPDERGAFDLVWDALPRERELVLRTFPMLGIPLAFLALGAWRGEGGDVRRDDFLALLLFTVGLYLPLLLTQLPLSESSRASWLLRTAPVPRSAIDAGTIKALFARLLLPLHFLLGGLTLALSGLELLARLWMPALLTSLLALRLLYPRCVRGLPLSVSPDELAGDVDWTGFLAGLAALLTLEALLANRLVDLPTSLLLTAGLVAAEVWLGRRPR